ncbi:hypothetical protein P154DRAFT_519161 [Amniculicola lignicola CBS 123094]|uniref:Uncharacterized protein n=1 Tax=Amniculicola lignicola CBS 123094 TaxID=1392246 RepID=A0A6A5WWZ7_9PLEO|nr:hypothetical protein P154DRAFT_519161 [Amniculicola lignicola CBS 123094]
MPNYHARLKYEQLNHTRPTSCKHIPQMSPGTAIGSSKPTFPHPHQPPPHPNPIMLFMIIEHFKHNNPIPIYARFRSQGRLAPEGLTYISSWVSADLTHCYQLMETEKRELLDEWMGNWRDLVEFEVVPVIRSGEASEEVAKMEAREVAQMEAREVSEEG